MHVAKAVRADIPELNVLVNTAYRGDTSKLGWTTEANLLDGMRIDEETLTAYLNDPAVTILKHTDHNGQITGCVYLEIRGPKLYVGMFSVSPLLQGRGIGRILLNAAEEHALNENIHILTMTVISIRHELISWYERRGYRATGEMLPFHPEKKFGVARQHIELTVLEKTI
ncbi:MAG TPA: GNAT family N-acetyltransferase [Mucilaginibacter sp.]|nr:GNAT family N-acetyltransferase [Mucilaginibacter sp.]